MEADWEFEVGGDAPVIEGCWPGFVDLRWTPQNGDELAQRIDGLHEAAQLPALAAALEKLNSACSPVWTSKCDFWPVLRPEEFDPGELDAPPANCAHAMGCYIDLLPRSDQQWPFPGMIAAACKHWCAVLGAVPLRCCRADLVIRRALIAPSVMDTGITAYLTACGPDPAGARQALEAALAQFAHALCPTQRYNEVTGE